MGSYSKNLWCENVVGYRSHSDIETIPVFLNKKRAIPNVTIAIPTYKRVDTLKYALESALNQEYQDYEIIVIDNNPERNDCTELFMFNYANEDRLSYYKNTENIGLFDNWNRCFLLSRTKWVTLLHDDDFYFPEYLSTMMRSLEKNKEIDALSCRLYFWKENEHETQIDDIDRSLFYKPKGIVSIPKFAFILSHPVGPVGMIFKKTCWEQIGGFNADNYPIADYIFDWKYFDKYSFKVLNTYLVHYRIGRNVSFKPETKELQERKNYELRQDYLSSNGYCKFAYKLVDVYFKSEMEFLSKKFPDYPLKENFHVGRWNLYKILIRLYFKYLNARRQVLSLLCK